MRSINILSHTFTFSNLDLDKMKIYSEHEMLYNKSNIREAEEKDLKKFVDKICQYISDFNIDMHILDGFFYNFTIPQISKEFDLLRIDNQSVINIEIKYYNTEDKIIKQLIRNKYFLSFLNRNCSLFCYIVNNDTLYELNQNDKLMVVEIKSLINLLSSQNNILYNNIEALFNVSNYLISPFNKTKDFINNGYFLNGQQESFKNKILNQIDQSNSFELFSVSGPAGSGKSLLIYDIAKELMTLQKKIVIIHCGQLNNGHKKLNTNHNWNIIPAKDYKKIDINKIDIIIIDEGQRIYYSQLEQIIKEVRNLNKTCIFCHDPIQTLSDSEKHSGSLDLINKYKTKEYSLSGRIRSNMEIIHFIDSLFNLRNSHNEKYENITFAYCKNYTEAKLIIKSLIKNKWKFINYTPCTFKTEDFECLNELSNDVAHTVIGQEYDNVVCIMDNKFYYKDNILQSDGWLSDKNGEKMLYQCLTRARKKIFLIIINNNQIFNRCLKICNNNTTT